MTPPFSGTPPTGIDVLSAIPKRCKRCLKPKPSHPWLCENWNVTFIASYATGWVCPDCQTVEEDLEAQVRLEVDPPMQIMPITDTASIAMFAEALLDRYPEPGIMYAKADELEDARPDCAEPARLMRALADAMESGEL